MMHLKQENIFGWLDIAFLKNHTNSKFRLTASLPDHIRKPICQMKPQFYGTTTNLPVRFTFWGSDECGASVPRCSFYLPLGSSSLCSETISMC